MPHPDAWLNELTEYRLQLLASGQDSDCEIKCKEFTFRVHRSIVLGYSKVFQAAFTHNLCTRNNETLDLSEEEPSIIARTLIYMYGDEVFTSTIHMCQGVNLTQFAPLEDLYGDLETDELAMRMFIFADKYMIEILKRAVRSEILKEIFGYMSGRPMSQQDTDVVSRIYTSLEELPAHDFESRIIKHACIDLLKVKIERQTGTLPREYVNLFDNAPAISIDYAKCLTVQDEEDVCEHCNRPVMISSWCCECGETEPCDMDKCLQFRDWRAICWHCRRFRAVDFGW